MLQSGELKALPGEREAIRRPRHSKKARGERVAAEVIEEEEPPIVMSEQAE
jgi:hypothetical protein